MLGLLKAGNKVWFSESDNPKRKLKYTLQIVNVGKEMVGINTHLTNKIVLEALKEKKIESLSKYKNIKTEVKFSDNTRFDFLCDDKILLEVKNVTLNRKNNIAEFPDAVTTRGSKHLNELTDSIKLGYKPYVLFLIQIQNINKFRIAKDIDENYYKDYIQAKKAGVKFLAYRCNLNSKEIKIEKKINIINE